MMDVVKTERSLAMVDDITNDAIGVNAAGPNNAGSGGVSAPVTPKESTKSQSVRRTVTKPIFEKDKYSFLCDLQMFHDKNGTPFAKLPKISGRDVDLHKLYSVVISRGGWMKVNAREDWDEVIEELDLPTRCVNNEIALKQIYIRFLDRYERVNYHGEDKDPGEDEDDEKRLHRRWTVRALHTMPSVYNHHQHNVPEALRSSLKLSEDLYRASEYDKLILSLLSPLPNEQDFAINVCTLMSNENKHTLKIDRCPRLVYALLAHAGVFNHFTLRDTFDEYYSNIRKNSLQRFWKECLFEKPQVLELSMEDYFAKMDTDPSALIASIYQQEEQLEDEENDNENEAETDHAEVAHSRLNMATLRTFLCLGTGLGTNDYIGQRVLQIASIFRNLSFNEENLSLLGHNRTFIRFLIMCSNARWNNLHHLGLDMLGNIANEIDVNDPQSDEITRCLLSTVSEGLEGADRGVIISCLEVLSKLAQKEANEDNLNRCLNQQLYDQITLFLFLNDIMLLLYTLECIYSLTSMGEKPCQAIMHVRGVLDTLVSLVTVEAQSYGPDACILMRVVETIPGNMAGPQGPYQPATPPHAGSMHTNPVPTMAQLTVHKDASSGTVFSTTEVSKLPNASSSPTIAANTNKPMPALSVTQMVTSQPASPAAGNQTVSITRPPAADSPQVSVNIIARPDSMAGNTDSRTVASGTVTGPSATLPPTSSLAAKHMQQQQVQESEQFACAWLRASFEMHTAPAIRTDQQEVYKLYMATNAKLGRKVIVPPSHFPRCVRTVFGASVGPVQFKMEQNGVESISTFYEGLKLRAKPLSIVHKGTVLAPNIEYVTASSALSSAATDCAAGPKQVANAGTTASTSSTTTLTTVPIDVIPNGSRLATTSVICSAKGQSLPVPSLTFTTPATVATIRSSSVIATAPASSAVSQSVVSVVQKTPSSHTPTITTQPPKTHISKHLVPYSSTPATVTVTAAPSSTKQQLIVTQVGGKSVLINQPTATTGGQQQQYLPSTPSSPLLQQVLSGEQKNNVIVLNQTTISPQPSPQSTSLLQHQSQGSVTVQQHHHHNTGTTTIMNQSGTISSTTTNPSALIKSLLANKVTTSAVPESTLATAVATAAAAAATTPSSSLSTTNITPTTNCLIAPNVNVRQVAQRQQLQKQKQMIEQKLPLAGGANASVVVTSNNPNNLTNIKVGNSTISIKPGTLPTNTVITATNPHEALNAPPPLAPLSQTGSQGTIIKTIMPDTASQLHQQKLLPNKVLSELLEKKPGEMIIAGETTIKRKIDADSTAEPPVKRIEVTSGESGKVKAADLYAELAGSILAGEATTFQAQQIAAMQAQAAGGTQKIFVNQQGQQILMTQLPRQVIVSHAGMAVGTSGNPPGTAIFTSAALSSHLSAATTTSTCGTMLPAAGASTPVGAGTIIEKKPIYITTNAQGNTISFEGPPQQLQVQTSASGQLQLKPIGPGTQVVNAGGHIIQQTPNGQQTIQFIQQGPSSQQLQQQPQTTQQIVFQAQSSPGPAQIIQQQIIQPAPGQQPQQIIQKVLQQQLAQATKPNQSQIITMQKQTPQQTVTIGPPSSISIQRQSGGIILPPKAVTSTPLSATPKQQIIQVVQQKLTTNPVSAVTIASQQQAFVTQRPILPSVPQTTTISQTVVGTGGPTPTPAPMQSISVTPVHQTPAAPAVVATITPAAPTTTTGGSPSTTPGPTVANNVPTTNTTPVTSGAASPPQANVASQPGIQIIPPADPQKFAEEEDVDPSWPWICDWRGCPRKKFNSATEVFRHACLVHCPDTVDLSADIYCQWGPGATLCDNLPRKRFSLMTHIFDRHCTAESFKAAVQRRLSGGPQHPSQPYPVTLIRQPTVTAGGNATNRTVGVSGGSNTSTGGRGSPAPATCTKIDPSSGSEGTGSTPAAGGSPSSTNGPGQLSAAGPAALHAIKRHTMEYVNSKEFQDEMEGPVTKSIRLTSALILRNLVVYSHSAKRNLRAYEAHLAGVALSNVESSRTVAQLLFEMNDTQPNY
ncbi:AT-rich interactive domain-containing protein 2 [Anopheles bellator]|uniref:AT-rich interactive domain-containing protein 2 n=1 Tax=Anopheles bellator TaxID=139047 RepID=UPI002647BE96|nr:AT-rich interactive domain-containing protein 2 [Anopheles bellator]